MEFSRVRAARVKGSQEERELQSGLEQRGTFGWAARGPGRTNLGGGDEGTSRLVRVGVVPCPIVAQSV